MAMTSTDRPGIRYILVNRKDGKGKERCYYGRWKERGHTIDARVGAESEGVTLARAAKQRVRWMTGADPLPQDVKRKLAAKLKADKRAEARRMTYGRIWELWLKEKGNYGSLVGDRTHWHRRIQPYFEDLTPAQVSPEFLINYKSDLKAMKVVNRAAEMKLAAAEKWGDKAAIKEAKKAIAGVTETIGPQTRKHVLGLLRRLTNWAVKKKLHKPVFIDWDLGKVVGAPTMELADKQIKKLIDVCKESKHPAGAMVLIALYTGARKKEILNLRWDRIDFEYGSIGLGVNLNTGTTKDGNTKNTVPMSSRAREVLESIPRQDGCPWVFPSPTTGKPYVSPQKALQDIKEAAELPIKFRILHGCRHTYATAVGKLANSMAIKELLHHKEVATSEKYVHLPPEHLARISEQVGDLYHREPGQAKVIEIDERRKA